MIAKPTYEELERRVQELEDKQVVTDIAERKQAEDAPRKNESIYRAFFEYISDAAFLHEVNEQGEAGRFIDVNETACRRLGYTREEFLSMAPGDITEPSEYKRLTFWRGEFENRGNILIETIHVAKDGRKIPVESNIRCINHLGKPVAMSVSRDITNRKQADEASRNREESLQAILDNSPTLISEFDLEGRYIRVNQAITKLLGRNSSELVGKTINEILPADTARLFMDRIKLVSSTCKPITVEDQLDNPEGDQHFITTIFPLFDASGRIQRIGGIANNITERKQAEIELKESERFLQILLESIPLPVFYKDVEGRYKGFNKAFETFFGRPKSELINCSVFDINPPELARRYHAKDSELFQKISTQVYESQVKNAYAELRDVVFHKATLTNTSGAITGLVGAIMDITDRKQAEKQQQKSEEQFQNLYDDAAIGIFHSSFEGKFLDVNPSLARMLGYDTPQNVMDSIYSISEQIYVEPQSRDKVMDRLLKKGETIKVENLYRRKDGSEWNANLHLRYVTDLDGEPVCLEGFVEDITDRKRMEEALKAERNQLLSIFNNIEAVIYISDLQTHELLYINKYLEDILPDNCIGKKCYKVLQGFDVPCSFCTNDIIFEKKPEPHRWEYYNPYLDRHFSIIDRVVRWTDGRDARFEMAVDISAIKKTDMEREKLQSQLHQLQKMESIGSLAGGVAHDFNNILFPIVGLSEMMLDDFPPGSLEQQNLNEIFQAGKRGRELVQQILSFSRQSEHQPIPVHIQKILKEVLRLCRATIPSDITITQDIKTDCGPVMADPTQIHQIAMNLITNAFHAVESAGGSISIQLTEMDLDQTDDPANNLAPGRYAMLSVSDTGMGIDPAVINKIFDPYFTTKEKGRGTGLGLATVYGIVKAHGGDIRVTSDIGKGAIFHVYLPLMEKSQELEPEKEKITPLPTGTEHILLVDDEKSIVHLEKQMLERLGYQTSVFTGSRDALAAFKTEPSLFDLVITDMNMPEMNGMKLATELIAVRPDIPIILCTGFSERVDNKKAEARGIRGLLMKPVGMKDLAHKVREVLK